MISPTERDALKEITQIGCGAAANALSALLGGTIIRMAPTELLPVSDVRIDGRLLSISPELVGVRLSVDGLAKGDLFLIYSKAKARRLACRLLGVSGGGPEIDALSQSALKELGNIVASAYLNATSALTGLALLPSIPHFVEGDPSSIAAQISPEAPAGVEAYALETWIEEDGDTAPHGRIYFAPSPEGLRLLLSRVKPAIRP